MRPAPVAVVQARMSSTRLPGKVLADLGGRPVLDWVVSRLRASRELAGVVVATSDEPEDDAVAEAAQARVFRGPLADVLARYAITARELESALAARELGFEGLVRVTADCPLIDPAVVDEVVAEWRRGDADYVANVIEPRTYPVGMDTEVVSAAALLAADAEATDPYDREHVTPFVRSRPERFPQRAVTLDPPRPDVRLTLDTPEDLEHLRAVVAATGPDASLAELIAAA
jgi:spore coat polysaccharide biosynthesis protein SpsF